MTSNYNNAISVSSFSPFPLSHKVRKKHEKVKTRYCGLSGRGNEHKSHVIMKERMQDAVVKCVFFSRVNDD